MTTGSGREQITEEPRLAVERPWWLRRRFLLRLLPLSAALLSGVTALALSGNFLRPVEHVVTLKGKMASNADFFQDPQVTRILLKHHIKVEITQSGSHDLATHDVSPYDFVFPSGKPDGDLITRARDAEGREADVHHVFVNPIVLATYRPYAETLVDRGVAVPQNSPDGQPLYYTLDMKKFLDLAGTEATWNSIGIGKHGLTNENQVVASTSDVCGSNSADSYLALVSYVQGNGDVPSTYADAEQLAKRVKPLLIGQGLSGADLSEYYDSLTDEYAAPIVVVYEHEYLGYQIHHSEQYGESDAQRVLLYPSVQSVSQPEFIALTPAGDQLGKLMDQDPGLRTRATQIGYRILNSSNGADPLSEFLGTQGIQAPTPQGNTTKAITPGLDILQRMISIVGDCKGGE